MKNILNSCILLYMTCMFMLPACEKSNDQTKVNVVNQNGQITTRSEECENCEFASCCCCLIEMIGQIQINLKICGLCDGDYLCGPYTPPSAPCSTVSGSGRDFNFMYPGTARQYFCVEPGASIRIENTTGAPVSFEFTCQAEPTPTPIIVTLAIGEVKFIYNDGECFVVDDCQ